MNTRELQGKSEAELRQLLSELRLKLGQLRFDMSSGKVKNIREVRDTKKIIARILPRLAARQAINAYHHAKKEA